MIKNLMRFAAMLAAVIVTADAFAQMRTSTQNNILGKNFAKRSAATTPAQAAKTNGGETAPEGEHALNFDAAPVDLVLEAYAREVDKTYLKDPAVPNATITLKSREGQKMTKEEYLEAIEVVLEMNQIHLEPYGEKFLRVLPRKEVRKEGIPIIMDQNQKLDDSNKVVSMMVQLKNISTEDGQKTLDNFKSGSGIIIAFERTNSLLITDTEQNINRMLEIVRAIDIAMPVLENVFVRQIKNANANDIKTALEAIVQESQKELEKSGNKTAANIATSPSSQRPTMPGGRIGAQKQPATPANNASVLMQVSDADRGMIRGKVLILADERSNKLVIVTQKPNMDFFDKVIEQLDVETTPDTVVKVYRLKYAEAEEVSDMINDLIGNSGSSKSSGKDSQNRTSKTGTGSNVTSGRTTAQTKTPANKRTGEAKAGELTKDNTTVLADKRINGLVVMTEKELVPTIEQIIESMDIKLSQVLIETVIIEVQLGDGIQTGMDWVQKGRKKVTTASTDPMTGAKTFYTQRTTTIKNSKTGEETSSTSFLDSLVPSGYSKSSTTVSGEDDEITTTISDVASSIAGTSAKISTDGIMNYYTAGTATAIGGGQGGELAYNLASGVTSNFFGKALNFVFDSEELGLSAILQASKTDSHSKYIASPIIMTLDNKEATIEATQMRYLFKGYQYSGSTYNGSAVPDYEQKELGITIKVTPKINPNGTVMLTLEEEYSQEGAEQPIQGEKGTFNAATTVTRKMSADALLENNQTVIFAGMTETSTSDSESGIPILKDIPWIGKWLFGTVKKDEDRTELLVFMTPYVLDDADTAQAEAIRRKRAISDQHAWDDHGWSASALADPVSKKEQLRRLKEEWKKQDEEREAKIAIEKEKINRVKQLEKMSKDERKTWLEMHKEELKEQEKDELEKKMLDEDSQEDLKKLADQIREKKLKAADKELDKTAKEYEQENEYNRIQRERKEKGEKGNGKEEVGNSAEKGASVESVEKKENEPAEPVKPETPEPSADPSALSKLVEEAK